MPPLFIEILQISTLIALCSIFFLCPIVALYCIYKGSLIVYLWKQMLVESIINAAYIPLLLGAAIITALVSTEEAIAVEVLFAITLGALGIWLFMFIAICLIRLCICGGKSTPEEVIRIVGPTNHVAFIYKSQDAHSMFKLEIITPLVFSRYLYLKTDTRWQKRVLEERSDNIDELKEKALAFMHNTVSQPWKKYAMYPGITLLSLLLGSILLVHLLTIL